jgi:hypothetical protein
MKRKKRLALVRSRINGVWKILVIEPVKGMKQ